MPPLPACGLVRAILTAVLAVGGFLALLYIYHKSPPSKNCHPAPYVVQQPAKPRSDKPTLLLWFWPNNNSFDFSDCKRFFNIDGCLLTDNRSMYSHADGVLIFHRAIKDDLSNLPKAFRPDTQRWIWFNMDVPAETRKIPGLDNIFNLTLSYKRDADIHVRWRIKSRKQPVNDFVLPLKKRLLCWIVGDNDPRISNGTIDKYYRELVKHIKIDVFGRSFAPFSNEDHFSTISSCKFYLAFEDPVLQDYITENLNGPLASGTVPVTLGPSRKNYEDFVPGDAFIHVNDFPDAKALAAFLLQLDKDQVAYKRYFRWRQYLFATPHLIGQNQEFVYPICLACDYLGQTNVYRTVRNLNRWFFR